jgi:hypothetical protein
MAYFTLALIVIFSLAICFFLGKAVHKRLPKIFSNAFIPSAIVYLVIGMTTTTTMNALLSETMLQIQTVYSVALWPIVVIPNIVSLLTYGEPAWK